MLFVVKNWILHCLNVALLLNAPRYMLLDKYLFIELNQVVRVKTIQLRSDGILIVQFGAMFML